MNQAIDNERIRRRSRGMYIAEAAVEYFISLCVTTTFLTILLNEMEVSTAYQGIISSLASLACVVQLFSIFGVKRAYPCKRWVCALNLLNQLLFCFLYIMPFTPWRPQLKLVAFIGMLLLAYFCQHFITPFRTQWHMENVDDNKRGLFTANKEIVSLIGGMIFSQCAAWMVEYFQGKGDMRTAFIIFAISIAVMALIHLGLMIGISEQKPKKEIAPKKFGEILSLIFGTKQLRLVILFDILFAISLVPGHFGSVYLLRTLEFSPVLVTIIAAVGAAFRAIVSRFLGRYADKHSWVALMRLCMLVSATGYLFFALCAPGVASLFLYPVYMLCHSFAMGGTNSARTNLCFDYVSHEDRRYVLGVKNAIAGLADFGVTLLVSLFVDMIEKNGNQIFGMTIYPQQIFFLFNTVLLLSLTFFFLPHLKKKTPQE